MTVGHGVPKQCGGARREAAHDLVERLADRAPETSVAARPATAAMTVRISHCPVRAGRMVGPRFQNLPLLTA